MIEAFGSQTDKWIGHGVITTYDKDVMFGTKKVGGIKVRLPKATAAAGEKPEDSFPE